MRPFYTLAAFLSIPGVLANVEKVIFKAPAHTPVPQDSALDNLFLLSLHPDQWSVRTQLKAAFPTDDKPHGLDTWTLLEGLEPGRRYELRVCWLATQPTGFWLDTYSLDEAFSNPELISSLSDYAHSRRGSLNDGEVYQLTAARYRADKEAKEKSFCFLRVQAAADYFSLNKTLMEDVPDVHVDLILDPYILNVFPQSLVPTAGYILVIAIIAWFLQGWIFRRLKAYIDEVNTIPDQPELKKIE